MTRKKTGLWKVYIGHELQSALSKPEYAHDLAHYFRTYCGKKGVRVEFEAEKA